MQEQETRTRSIFTNINDQNKKTMKYYRRTLRIWIRHLQRNPVLDILLSALIGYLFAMGFILVIIYTLLTI